MIDLTNEYPKSPNEKFSLKLSTWDCLYVRKRCRLFCSVLSGLAEFFDDCFKLHSSPSLWKMYVSYTYPCPWIRYTLAISKFFSSFSPPNHQNKLECFLPRIPWLWKVSFEWKWRRRLQITHYCLRCDSRSLHVCKSFLWEQINYKI